MDNKNREKGTESVGLKEIKSFFLIDFLLSCTYNAHKTMNRKKNERQRLNGAFEFKWNCIVYYWLMLLQPCDLYIFGEFCDKMDEIDEDFFFGCTCIIMWDIGKWWPTLIQVCLCVYKEFMYVCVCVFVCVCLYVNLCMCT